MKNPNLIVLFNQAIHYAEPEQKEEMAQILGVENNDEVFFSLKVKALRKLIQADHTNRHMYAEYTIHNNEEKLYSLAVEKADKSGYFQFHTKERLDEFDLIGDRGYQGHSTSRDYEKRGKKRKITFMGFLQDFKEEFL